MPADRIVHYALAAGTNALNRYATEEAQSAFERGLASLGEEKSETAAMLWSRLGQAQASNLPRIELQKAVDSLGRAFDMFLDLGIKTALSDEQFVEAMAERRQVLNLGPNDHVIGCPLCLAPLVGPLGETADESDEE